MKKLSLLLSTILLFTGISFASSLQVKQDNKAKTEKKVDKKNDKKAVKKVPVRKTVTKTPATKSTSATNQAK